jgi:hypothetical protein
MADLVDEEHSLRGSAVDFDEVEVAGVYVDSSGCKWPIPADDDSLDGGTPLHPLQMPKEKRDPGLHYQTCHVDQLGQEMSRGFLPVQRKEAGIPESAFAPDFGRPEGTIHRVGDTILVKIPKKLEQRLRRDADRLAQEAIDSVEPVGAQLERLKQKSLGIQLTAERAHRVDSTDPDTNV